MALDRVGVQAVIEGLGSYKTGAGQIAAANQQMTSSAQTVATQSSFMSSKLDLVKIAAVGAGVALAGMVVKSGLGLASMLEQSEIGFTTMLGSVEKAKEYLKDLYEFAAKTPFQMAGLVGSTQKLLAYGFAAEDVIPMLTSIGDASSALGAGQAGIDRMTRALGQMRAKGKVSAEEMMQLAEIGVPAWQMLAEAIGVDIPTAMKMAEKGTIRAAETIPALLEGMNKRFGGLMEKQALTMQGLWSTFMDTWSMAAANVMRPLLPSIKEGIRAGTSLLEVFTTFGQILGTIGIVIRPIVSVLSSVAQGFAVLTKFLKENREIMIGIGIAFGAIAAAKLAAYVVEVYNIARAFGFLNVMAATLQGTMAPLSIALAAVAIAAALITINIASKRAAAAQKDAAEATKQWVDRQAEALKLEAQTYHLDEMSHSVVGLATEYKKLAGELLAYQQLAKVAELRPTLTIGTRAESIENLQRVARAIGRISPEVDALKAKLLELNPSMAQLDVLVKAQYIDVKLVNEVFPKYKEYAGSAAAKVDTTTAAVDGLNKVFKAQIDNITLLTSQLREYDSALEGLAGTETAEEVNLKAASSALQAQIALREAQIRTGVTLTQGQQDELALWKDQKEGLDAVRDAIKAKKDADVAAIETLAQGRPTLTNWTSDLGLAKSVYVDLTGQLVTSVGSYQVAQSGILLVDKAAKDLQSTINQFSGDPIVMEFYKLANAAYAAGAGIIGLQKIAFNLTASLPPTIAAGTTDYYRNLDKNLQRSDDDFRSIKKTVEEVREAATKIPPVLGGEGPWGIPGAAEKAAEAVEKIVSPFDDLIDRIRTAISVVDKLRGAFSSLFGKPSREQAQLQAKMSQLRLTEAQQKAAGYNEKQLKPIESQIAQVQALLDIRSAEKDVLQANLDLMDKTLLGDTEQYQKAFELTEQMGAFSGAMVPVIGQYWAQATAMGNWMQSWSAWLDLIGAPIGNFDRGGIVPGPVGEPRLIIAHGGEPVGLPSSYGKMPPMLTTGMSAQNYAINVNAQGATVEEIRRLAHSAIDDAFRRAERTSRRGGVPLSSGIG